MMYSSSKGVGNAEDKIFVCGGGSCAVGIGGLKEIEIIVNVFVVD